MSAAARRQAAYRDRQKVLIRSIARFRESFEQACDRAGSPKLADDLPDEPTAWLDAITERLETKALVGFKRKPEQ